MTMPKRQKMPCWLGVRKNFNADSLGSIADCCDARLRDEIILLNQSLYGKNKSGWNGKKFLQAFTENNARANIVQIEETSTGTITSLITENPFGIRKP